jgi:parallel beta-helix repeat protein
VSTIPGTIRSRRPRTTTTFLAVAALIVGLASVSMVALPSHQAGAATDVVTNCSGDASTSGSLPYEVANASAGDSIAFELSPSCSLITLSATIDISQNITIDGPGQSELAVSGNNAVADFSVGLNVAADISGLTIEDGSAEHGGGVENNGTLNLTQCTVTENAGYAGGGIWNAGILTVLESTVSHNSAALGGGVFNSATASITDSTVSDNSATEYGGGVYGINAFTVADSTVSGNTASEQGGGLYEANWSLGVSDSTVSGNTAGQYGGGIESYAATLTVDNSTVSGNTATSDDGGGIDIEDNGMSTIENSTLWDNSAPSYFGGGIQDDQGPLTIGATIVADSPTGGDCFLQGVSTTDLGDNLSDDASCGFSGSGDLSSTASGLDSSGLENNGGPTETIALEPGSSAIHHVSTGSLCPATDQRGAPRTAPCDIGAYDTSEGPFTEVVVTGSQTYGGSPSLGAAEYPPAGVTVSGTVTCTTVDGGTAFVDASVGPHTVDGSSCSGLTPSADPLVYAGSPDGYVVSPDSTTTSLSTDVATQNYGEEGSTTFTVTVQTGNGEPLPTADTATVDVGSASCVATLTPGGNGGSGGCSIAGTALLGGSFTASVTYGGDADLSGSGPATTPFTVIPSTTTVSSVSPDTGYTTTAAPVTITGTGFTGATVVSVGGVDASNLQVVNDSTITATLPTFGSAGPEDVTVIAPGGLSAINPADTFTYTVEASPTVVSCTATCSTSVSTPLDSTTVAVSGPVTSGAQVSLVTNTASLSCGAGYTYASPLTTLLGTGFNGGANLTVKMTVGGVPTVVGAKVCYQGTRPPATLATCGIPKVAPCVKSLVEKDGSAVVKMAVPAGDPRWKLVTPEATLTSFTPAKGDPGTPVTITGTNLGQITSVVVGGATAPISQQSATTLVVTVPQNAVKGFITLDADSGIVTSTTKFKVK